MITCPLCNKEVKDPIDQKQVPEDRANDFYCPDYITMKHPTPDDPIGHRLCHFSRKQLRYLMGGATAYTYQAIVPPYQIVWVTNHKTQVYKLDSDGNREGEPIFHSKMKDYETFIKTCQRFKVLVPFS